MAAEEYVSQGMELMKDEEKHRFDAYESIRDHAWREFEDKARAEWQLSFGIWVALLAVAGALIGTGRTGSGVLPSYFVWIIVGAVVVAHAIFLYWIQTKLQSARECLSEAQNKMRCIVGLQRIPFKRSIWKQVSMYVQFGISILLAGVLICIFRWWISGQPGS